MGLLTSVVFATALILTAGLFAQQPSIDPARATHVAWLKEHAIPLQSIDPKEEDFSDLEPLRQAIGEARIVQLGEQTHSDGSTFLAKTRLIKFLHQKMGYEVLAFESGLYDCRKAWEALKGGVKIEDALPLGMSGTPWLGSEQAELLFQHVGQMAQTERPLELCGFDSQFTGNASLSHLVNDVKGLLQRLGDGHLDVATRTALPYEIEAMAGRRSPQDEAAKQQRKEIIGSLGKALAAAQPSAELSADEIAFWKQYCESLAGQVDQFWESRTRGDYAALRRSNWLRDAQMAKNLVWLARQAYPKKKIIVWAASYHLLRNPSMVEPINGGTPSEMPAEFYRDAVTMGHEVWKEFAKETYTLAFVAAEGQVGAYGRPPIVLSPPLPGSLEDLLVAAGQENAIVDFRHLDGSGAWLREKLPARPLGISGFMSADWTNIFDGFVFTRVMTPSTPSELAKANLATRMQAFNAAAAKKNGPAPVAKAPVANPAAKAPNLNNGRVALGWGGPLQGQGNYEAGIDKEIKKTGLASLYVKSTIDRPVGSGSVGQVFAANAFRGKRVRLTAAVKAENVEGRAGLWMRVDSTETTSLAFDNMLNRPIQGTADWKRYEIVLDLPEDASKINFGMLLFGKGQIWVDDFEFEIVDTNVATTMLAVPRQPRAKSDTVRVSPSPINLDFEG